MNKERFEQVNRRFIEAQHLGGEERQAFLDRACDGDPDLRREVDALFEADREAAEALATAHVHGQVGRAAAESIGVGAAPETIGQYRIIRLIGEGGMGSVYEAEQDDPRRRVALKVIRPGMVSRKLLQRFRHEAQVLGQLRHPGIAQIYEAGTEDRGQGGQPYFAMELVTGRQLLEFAKSHGLGTRDRLELVACICDALHHAHQKGVIHRDLKPGNILVEAGGQPKILDFGVARATDADIQTVTLATDVGELVGTVPYMSPEQASGDPDALDIRSDLYAMGVISFELLGGRLPYQVAGKMIHEAVRVIREEEPSRLSSIDRTLRGDVETIVAKALEKDKDRRYQSAAELAADIRRYLDDEPIVARPASTFYQLSKFTRRNKAVVTSTAVLFVMLVAGLVAVTAALAVARRQATIAQAVNDFLNDDLLSAVDPRRTADRELTVREVLDAASASIDGKFPDEPLVEAAIRLTLGETYTHLSEYDAAEPHLARALQLRRTGGAADTDIAESAVLLGMVYIDLARFDEAEALLVESVETTKRVAGPTAPETLDAMNNLGAVYYRQKRYEEAESIYQETIDIGRKHQPRHEATMGAMASLALLRQRLGRLDEAEPLSLEAVEVYQDVLGREHPYTLTAMNNLAILYSDKDRFDKAEPLFIEVLDIRLENLGETHSDTLVSKGMLGRAYYRAGRFEQAEVFAVEAHEGMAETLGPEHPYTTTMIGIIISMYEDWEKPAKVKRWQATLDALEGGGES